MDAGYDVGAVHRGFELMGITNYCSIRESHIYAMKKGFTYDDKTDSFIFEKPYATLLQVSILPGGDPVTSLNCRIK